jgi:type II secretory pathway component PulF
MVLLDELMPNSKFFTLDVTWPRASRLAPWWPADSLDARQQSLAHVLRGAVAGQIAAAPLVAGLAAEHRWTTRRRLNRLADRLQQGIPLADALEQTPGALSDEGVLAIRFGSQLGILPAVLDGLLRDDNATGPQLRTRFRQMARYLASVLLVGTMVASFILTKIIPSFFSILADFTMPIPWALRSLVDVSDFAVTYLAVPFMILLALAWFLSAGPPKWYIRRLISARILRPVAQLCSADLIDLLALATRAGRPLTGALSTLARYHYNAAIRQKLLFVRNEVEQGANLWQSLKTVRLITPAEARVLTLESPIGATDWTLEHLAQTKRTRVASRIETLFDWFEPACVVLLASAVLLIALALMLSLNQMIGSLA